MGLPKPSLDDPTSTVKSQDTQQQKATLEETHTQSTMPPTSPPTNTTTSPLTSTPPTASSLPPAALDLASKLFDYARHGETSALAEYLAAGIPPNLTNSTGDTLLMLAAYHGHAATVAELLRRGADPDALNDKGQSPLAGAVFKGHEAVVRTLVGQGRASVDAGQPNAVDCARMFRRTDMLALFGADEAV